MTGKITCLECGKELHTLGKNHFRTCSGAARSNAEYLVLHPNAQTMSLSARKDKAVTQAKYVDRFGKEKGMRRWADYCQKLSDKNSFEFFQSKRGWTREQFDEYNKSRGVTLQNLVAKYGAAEGEIRFNAYREVQKRNGNTADYFIEKFGEIDGRKKYVDVCSKKGITRKNMIRVHGEIEGMIRHEKWLKSDRHNSRLADQFIRELMSKLPASYKFHSAENGGEFCVYKDRPFLFDLVITSPVSVCIEFNGDFWHANPNKYQASDFINLRGTNKKLASEIWEADALKQDTIRKRGYEVIVIWESEYLAEPKKKVEEIATCILNIKK